jgi:predicted adenylyl cyclase CyaB
MKKEIEVKIKLEKNDNVAKRLKKLGGKKGKKYKQTTYGFFSKDSIKKGIFPRIRIENSIPVLTVKVKHKKKTDYFERDEHSIRISSVKTGIQILRFLGFDKVREFTKIREHWHIPNRKIEITVDKLYFGKFIELEGTKKEIEKTIKDLGLKERKRIKRAYLALEDDYRKKG